MRGATQKWSATFALHKFQSTRPMRGATLCPECRHLHKVFQSTRPMRGATAAQVYLATGCRCFNPRAPCGARRLLGAAHALETEVSIHAPHAGRDAPRCGGGRPENVSIHAPHAGRDESHRLSPRAKSVSIHAPHAGRDLIDARFEAFQNVSIHAPHAGRDFSALGGVQQSRRFNPRAPCGARL